MFPVSGEQIKYCKHSRLPTFNIVTAGGGGPFIRGQATDMKDDKTDAFSKLCLRLREIGTLRSVQATLSWDQETMMPAAAAEFRGEEMALLSTLIHRQFTDAELGDLMEAAGEQAELREDPALLADLREIRRDYANACKLPVDLVSELSLASTRGLTAWKQAREESRFEHFRPHLETLLDLNRRKAACLQDGDEGEPYDALLDEYEPGFKGSRVEALFTPLRRELVPLIEDLAGAPDRPDPAIHEQKIDVDRQIRFSREIARAIGYDFDAGRLDISTHPFTEGLAPGDTRITSRFQEAPFADGLGSTMHEAGHALYEQGLPKNEYHGRPLSEAVSLGIHESQSRLWENQVGRSRPFWNWAAPRAGEILGLEDPDPDSVYRAMNLVSPGLIRVESDEATYNLHIMLRFDLERAMLHGELQPADLPAAWNERVLSDLGLTVPDDARGCLQDIHWSMGAIGYFPTYTLGNLYSAQIWEAVRKEMPDLDARMEAGEFEPLLSWLRENIHRHGRRWPAEELGERVTGKRLSHEPLMHYLRGKLRPIYGLSGS